MRATKGNIIRVIRDAVLDAHDFSLHNTGCALNKSPEYLMAVWVGKAVCDIFPTCAVNFEYSVQAMMVDLGIAIDDDEFIEHRINGRFDLVIKSRKTNLPLHIVEFKRGKKFSTAFEDVKRLALISDRVEQGNKVESNFFVYVTKYKIESLVDSLKESLANEYDKKSYANKIGVSLVSSETVSIHEDESLNFAIVEVKF
ncbi:hypothetical protein [Shewanella sp. FJAT-52076]|uniref:hypothetical protein n=1 Tax=Shewanella sp. FJAT-52076 TaxID=2864202 RepID=UPI001C65ECEF|nr:hypothetical protein [Shewanella sp. FJAT-52076]QYJ73684.1 hypothetical protein K0H79_09710 [Shewanella sp. FJAT-52076]